MDRQLWSIDKVKTDIHKSMREHFPSLFGEKWQDAGEIYKNAYRSQHLDIIQLLPGAVDLINFLYQQNILLFVISNKMGNVLRMEVENLQIKDRFFAIIGASDANFDKPHHAPVDLALKGSGVDPKKDLVWFIGDTITDIECAINSNCKPILYGRGANVPKDLITEQASKAERPMLCFDNHQEILDKLKSLN